MVRNTEHNLKSREEISKLKKRLDMIKEYLFNLEKQHSNNLDFAFSYKITDDNGTVIDTFSFSLKDISSALDLQLKIDEIVLEAEKQLEYSHMLRTSEAMIVVCKNDDSLPNSFMKLIKNKLYKVDEVIIENGESFYLLEGMSFDSELYRGYSSKRFNFMFPKYLKN